MTALCPLCFGDRYIREMLEEQGTDEPCSFGCRGGKSLGLRKVADLIDAVLSEHYSPVMNPEEDGEGEDPERLIARLTGLDARRVSAVYGRLRAHDPQMYERNLAFRLKWFTAQSHQWDAFKTRVKFNARFLDLRAQDLLDDLFRDLATFCGGVAVRTLEAGTPLFRARRARRYEDAERMINEGIAQLGPPREPSLRLAGRMNAAGISVLYAASHQDVAISEVRPSVGELVVVAPFETTRPLRVLDVANLPLADSCGESLFAPSFAAISERLAFLHAFGRDISEPVQPHDEPLDFVPTQMAAEYLARDFNGIVYRSAQLGLGATGKHNIVLFPAEPGLTDDVNAAFGVKLIDDRVSLERVVGVDVRSCGEVIWSRYPPPEIGEEEGNTTRPGGADGAGPPAQAG